MFHEIRLTTVDSTNRYASERATEWPLPAVVVTETQTAGRGRGGNRWWSGPGGLTCSLVVAADQSPFQGTEQGLLSLLTAAVLRDYLLSIDGLRGEPFHLKWPNDLYLRERKVCGILLEQASSDPARLVIGVGLNVNNSWSLAPEELREQGIALCDVLGGPYEREELLQGFLRHFAEHYSATTKARQLLCESWKQAHLLDGRIITLEQSGAIHVGRCEGVDEDGALLLRDMHTTRRIHSATILDWE